MRIIFKVGKDFVDVSACDICGNFTKPKGGKEIIRKGNDITYNNIKMLYICKKCGKDKFHDDKSKK